MPSESLIETLRSKRQFIPGGAADDHGVWHDGPHQAEFDAALDELRSLLVELDSAVSHLHYRKSWPLDVYDTDRLISRLRKEGP